MECNCGANMRDGKAERSKVRVVLDYQTCVACGRVEFGDLVVRGHVVASGVDAQRAFVAMEEGAPAPAPRPAQQAVPESRQEVAWHAVPPAPSGNELVEVRFLTGGGYIERPSFFDGRWDLIAAWRPYDNGPALAAARIPKTIPPHLRVGYREPAPEPRAACSKADHAPMPAVPPMPSDVPRGTTLSLF